MPRSSTAIASAVYCGASSSSEGNGSSCAGSPAESSPANTAPASVRYATKSPAVTTSVVPDGVEADARSASSSRSVGSASSMRVTLLKLSLKMYAASPVCTTWSGLLMPRTVSSSPTDVFTRAYRRPSPVCSAHTAVSTSGVSCASRPGHTTLTPMTSGDGGSGGDEPGDRPAAHHSTPVANMATTTRAAAATTAATPRRRPRAALGAAPAWARRTRCPRRARARTRRWRRGACGARRARCASGRGRAATESAKSTGADAGRPLLVGDLERRRRQTELGLHGAQRLGERARGGLAAAGSRFIAVASTACSEAGTSARGISVYVARAMRRRSSSLVF